ncbi:MAG TPA: hypothetical protein VLN59_08205 [Burkholderiales bacterium]|nr:hypothetical protein [Burkholderiales bacterium]
MKTQLVWAALGVVLAVPLDVASAQSSTGATAVRVYDATQLAMADYSIIKRIWVEYWRSAFDIPARPTADAATQELIAEAAALRADGVVNLTCVPSSSSFMSRTGYRCYGDAIRLKPKTGTPSGG